MTAILAEFANYLTLPSVLAASPDFTLMAIIAVVIIGAAGIWSAVALKQK